MNMIEMMIYLRDNSNKKIIRTTDKHILSNKNGRLFCETCNKNTFGLDFKLFDNDYEKYRKRKGKRMEE